MAYRRQTTPRLSGGAIAIIGAWKFLTGPVFWSALCLACVWRLGTPSGGYASVDWGSPRELRVDSEGLHFNQREPFVLRWADIDAILVTCDFGSEDDLEGHRTEIHLKQGPAIAEIEPAPKARTYHVSWPAPTIIVLEPTKELSLSPTVALEALDRFRRDDVPIYDPRRIHSPEGTLEPERGGVVA